MDSNNNKAWLWRKKSAEKTVVASEKSLRENEDEVQALLAKKAELEKDLKTLEAKLCSALSDCSTKDELAIKHTKMAQESIQGWENAKEEAVSLKLQLDEALRQRLAAEERLSHLDLALKKCMQQLRFVQEEQEQRIQDALIKTLRECEKTQMMLEEKLLETSKRLSKIVTENAHLGKALLLKEKLIDELNGQLNQVEADFGSLMTRVEATEKDNASFKYEVRVLEKELEIRNEEREFNRRTAEASHRQHLDSVKKIAKLESECQRLRFLIRKRLPGPAALEKMKNEVEMLGRGSVETRTKSNSTSVMFNPMEDNSSETPSKRFSLLTEQLLAMEEENKNLREVLMIRTNELQSLRNMYSCTASKLLQLESQSEASSRGLMITEPARNSLMSHETSLASLAEIGSDGKASCAESWASALILELENFRIVKQKVGISKRGVGASDTNLMDDFAEMEKLAVISVEKPASGSHVSSKEAISIAAPLENEYSSELAGTEIVPLSDIESGFSTSNQGIKYSVDSKIPVCLQDILKLVMEQNRATGRSFGEIIEEIRVALDHISCPKPGEHVDSGESSNHFDVSSPSSVNISQSSKSNQKILPNNGKSIYKIIELIEGLGLPSADYENSEKFSGKSGSYSCNISESPEGYIARVLQWKTSELSAVLQQYVRVCYDLLNGKADLDKFVHQLTIALEWIINHCFSLQDVSSMRDAIIKQCDWDDCESEVEVGVMLRFPGTDVSSTNVEERRKSKDGLMDGSEKTELEGRLLSATEMSDELRTNLRESEKVIETLKTELQASKKERAVIEDQIEHQKMMNEDLDTQLTVTSQELKDLRQQFSSLEVELENKTNCFEELQATCVELQLQLESMKKETPNSDHDEEEKQLRTDREITAASEKLAECQETILNLGKQLQAMSAPRESAPLDKAIVPPNDAKTIAGTTRPTVKEGKSTIHRTSLLDRMLADDDGATKNQKSPETKEIDSNSTTKMGPYGPIEPPEKILVLGNDDDAVAESMAVIPTKKNAGVSFWKKLLWRKNRGKTKKPALSLAS